MKSFLWLRQGLGALGWSADILVRWVHHAVEKADKNVRAPMRQSIERVSRNLSLLLAAGSLCLVAGCVSDKKPAPPLPPAPPAGALEALYMLTTPFAVNLDGIPGPDGIAIKIYASGQNQTRSLPIESGALEVLLYDGLVADVGALETAPLRTWKFTADQLKPYEIQSAIGANYQLALPWGDKKPQKSRVTVVARYVTPKNTFIYSAPSTIAVGQ